MATTSLDARQRAPVLPPDLRQTIGERALIRLSLEAVEAVGTDLPPLSGNPDGSFSPQMFLTLLTYCYASGIYGSEDIEWDCRNDPSLAYICACKFPDQEAIRCFRRACRPWIEAALMEVYAKAGRKTDTPSGHASAPHPALASFVRRKLELAVMFDTAMWE